MTHKTGVRIVKGAGTLIRFLTSPSVVLITTMRGCVCSAHSTELPHHITIYNNSKRTLWQKQPLQTPFSTPWPISFACKPFNVPQLFPETKHANQANPNNLSHRPDECLEMAYLYLNKYKRFQSSSSPSHPDPLDNAVRFSLSLSLKP